ncbi:hypothetical protein ACP275_07G094000 [Erythranthe tilingii]
MFLFRQMVRMQTQPSFVEFNKLLQVIFKMEQYSVALKLFDEMRQWAAPMNECTLIILINFCCLLKRVDIGFAIFDSFLKQCYVANVVTRAAPEILGEI